MSTDTTSTVDQGTPPTRDTRVDVQPRPHHLPGTGATDSVAIGGGFLLAAGVVACLVARRRPRSGLVQPRNAPTPQTRQRTATPPPAARVQP